MKKAWLIFSIRIIAIFYIIKIVTQNEKKLVLSKNIYKLLAVWSERTKHLVPTMFFHAKNDRVPFFKYIDNSINQ